MILVRAGGHVGPVVIAVVAPVFENGVFLFLGAAGAVPADPVHGLPYRTAETGPVQDGQPA